MAAEHPRWAATLRGVRDVTIRVSCDLAYWKRWLDPVGLTPLDAGGRAEAMVMCAEGEFHRVRFREVSVSISTPAGASSDAFLLHAYNSRRFFAWSERVFFHTPYTHGEVDLGLEPLRIAVNSGRREVLLASSGSSVHGQHEDSRWEGRVWLPASGRTVATRYFHARLEGSARRIAATEGDVLRVHADGPLAPLRESSPRFEEFIVREDAMHAKSVTYDERQNRS